MTQTTLYGNIGKWSGLASGVLALIASQVPPGNATNYVAMAAALLAGVSHAANGQGNIQSKTGGAEQ